ncbi:SDR family oxidoreductase [bacterium]|nr:SDR family oxidoreductase [bacterium]
MPGALEGKTALVTGGGRGIGRACALELASRGAAVAVGARSQDEVERVAKELEAGGARARAVRLDVTKEESIAAAVSDVERSLGDVAILVNNAGVAPSASFEKTDPALWRETLDVNLTGPYLVTRAVLPGMLARGWGRIVNLASIAGKVGFPYVSAYCASKHGLVGLTRALATEVAKRGVTVNAVCPGYVATRLTDDAAKRISKKTGLTPEQARATFEAASPQGRMMGEDEVARLVVFLCEPGQGGINGQALNLDGGGVTS